MTPTVKQLFTMLCSKVLTLYRSRSEAEGKLRLVARKAKQ